MKRTVLTALLIVFGFMSRPLSAALEDTIPVLESDLNHAQLSQFVNDLSIFRDKIPDAHQLPILEHGCNDLLPRKRRIYMRLFDCLSDLIIEDPINKAALLEVLDTLMLKDAFDERQTYGNVDEAFVETVNVLCGDRYLEPSLAFDNPHIIFLKDIFLEGGRHHVDTHYTALIENTQENIARFRAIFDRLSEDEEAVAQDMIHLCNGLIQRLHPLTNVHDNMAFQQRFDDLKNTQDYQEIKHAYDALRGVFINGEYLTLADVIDEAG